jgi:DNA polymerase-3 subunit beta
VCSSDLRVIDAAFPDYRQVIPKAIDGWFKVSRLALLGALRRIGILASERTHGVRLTPSEGSLLLVSDNPDLGKAREEIEIEDYKGDGKMMFAINAKYLQEALGALGGVEAVEIGINDPLSPVMVRVAGEPDAFRHIIMPMRV